MSSVSHTDSDGDALRLLDIHSASLCLTEKVLAVTQDGRVIIGTLQGFDNVGSIILSGCVERVFGGDSGVIEEPLGLYIMRGDAM